MFKKIKKSIAVFAVLLLMSNGLNAKAQNCSAYAEAAAVAEMDAYYSLLQTIAAYNNGNYNNLVAYWLGSCEASGGNALPPVFM